MPGIPNKIKIIQFGSNNNYWYRVHSLNSKAGKKEYKEPNIVIDNVFDKRFKIKKISFYRKIIEIEYQNKYKEFKGDKPLFTLELTSFMSYMEKYGIKEGSMLDGNMFVCIDDCGLSVIFKESDQYKNVIKNYNDLYHAKRLYKFEQGGIYKNKYGNEFLCIDAKEKRFLSFHAEEEKIIDFGLASLNFDIKEAINKYKPRKDTWSGKISPGYLEYCSYSNYIVKTPRVYLQSNKISKQKMLEACIQHYNKLMAKIESYEFLVEIYKKENSSLNYDINNNQNYINFLKIKDVAIKMNKIINQISNQS